MSQLLDKQMKFARLLTQLLQFMLSRGYAVTFGDFYVNDKDVVHAERSLHRSRLAADLNLFKMVDQNWMYCGTTEDHRVFGEWWEALDPECAWGGRFGVPDGNHYSITWEGRK